MLDDVNLRPPIAAMLRLRVRCNSNSDGASLYGKMEDKSIGTWNKGNHGGWRLGGGEGGGELKGLEG